MSGLSQIEHPIRLFRTPSCRVFGKHLYIGFLEKPWGVTDNLLGFHRNVLLTSSETLEGWWKHLCKIYKWPSRVDQGTLMVGQDTLSGFTKHLLVLPWDLLRLFSAPLRFNRTHYKVIHSTLWVFPSTLEEPSEVDQATLQDSNEHLLGFYRAHTIRTPWFYRAPLGFPESLSVWNLSYNTPVCISRE